VGAAVRLAILLILLCKNQRRKIAAFGSAYKGWAVFCGDCYQNHQKCLSKPHLFTPTPPA
ncbi:hypothetical protein, partial [Pseudomonas sp. MD195_PC81_125]|uniref:hypothetical protein n=1 Tax=Pseudomonas sp. MD195_PC81_125 TaxID=2741560 RepID=UPI001C711172